MSSSAFNNYTLKSAEEYLQTVVVIDDRIYDRKRGDIPSRVVRPDTSHRKPAVQRSAQESEAATDLNRETDFDEERSEVSFHSVQDSFAKKRIVCSLYQPKPSASFGEQSVVYKFSSTADVVIVDWDLHGDGGEKATTLVGTLIERSQDDTPHQLRLVLVYTLEPNLGATAHALYQEIEQRLGPEEVAPEAGSEELVLTTQNTRVVVLGKRDSPSLPQYSNYRVPEGELANRTIQEFSRLASGLLQGIALRGIAELRKNNRRILSRFQSGLDAAFLSHRSLLLPDESFSQLIPLLTDEIRAVLEDTLGEHPLGSPSDVDNIVTSWCEENWRVNTNARLELGDNADGMEFVKDALLHGPALATDYSQFRNCKVRSLLKNGKWRKNKCDELVEYLLGHETPNSLNQKLSSLMSQREKYRQSVRTLHLGVVVRELAGKRRYLLCLQPVCDGVRLNGDSQPFVFCVLDEKTPPTHCLVDNQGNLVQLQYRPKATNTLVSVFKGNRDKVYAKRGTDGRYVFKQGKKCFEWVAELKMEHAQRAAEQFARKLSRVGLTESEWLRLMAR